MRTLKAIHKAVYEPIGDLITYKALPTHSIDINAIDPFIFLNHHGYQNFLPRNGGLPFGPHPHRGFETVTFILQGEMMHKDSSGTNSIIREGGIQWMTAGKGLIHAEVSPDQFKALGGPLEILQLWLNLPAKYKMTEPKYTGLQKEDIPSVTFDEERVRLHVVAGVWPGVSGPIQPLTDVHLSWIDFKEGGMISFQVPAGQNIFLYVVKGEISANGQDVPMLHLAEFNKDGEELMIKANTEAVILFGYATPFNEPLMAYGPFVMNTREEVMQAYEDYRNGVFGNEEELM